MKSYNELLEEKTRIRLENPDKYNMLTMVLSTAGDMAKAEQTEVTERHIKKATRKLIATTSATIVLVERITGDETYKSSQLSKYTRELELLKEFLDPELSEELLRTIVRMYVETTPEEDRVKKNSKTYMAALQVDSRLADSDPKLISKVLQEFLK